MNIIIIKDNLAQLNQTWAELFEKSGCRNPFLSWQWSSAWWKYFGRDYQLMVLLAEHDGEPVAIAPLMVSTKGAARKPKVQFIGSNLADYSDFLTSDKDGQSSIMFWDYLTHLNNGTMINLGRLTNDSAAFQAIQIPASQHKNTVISTVSNSPYIKINCTWEQFYKNINKSIKKDLNWCANKLERLGRPSFERTSQIDSNTLDEVFAIQMKRQEHKPRHSQFEDNRIRVFFREISKTFGERDWLDFSSLKLNDKIIAYSFGFKLNGTAFYWNVSFDPSFRNYHRAKLFLDSCLRIPLIRVFVNLILCSAMKITKNTGRQMPDNAGKLQFIRTNCQWNSSN